MDPGKLGAELAALHECDAVNRAVAEDRPDLVRRLADEFTEASLRLLLDAGPAQPG